MICKIRFDINKNNQDKSYLFGRKKKLKDKLKVWPAKRYTSCSDFDNISWEKTKIITDLKMYKKTVLLADLKP